MVSAWGISAKSRFLLIECFGVMEQGAPWQRGALLREQEVAEEKRRADAGPPVHTENLIRAGMSSENG